MFRFSSLLLSSPLTFCFFLFKQKKKYNILIQQRGRSLTTNDIHIVVGCVVVAIATVTVALVHASVNNSLNLNKNKKQTLADLLCSSLHHALESANFFASVPFPSPSTPLCLSSLSLHTFTFTTTPFITTGSSAVTVQNAERVSPAFMSPIHTLVRSVLPVVCVVVDVEQNRKKKRAGERCNMIQMQTSNSNTNHANTRQKHAHIQGAPHT